jgi:hypothetical protein
MALNVTNSKKISSILGSAETDEWGGQAITLYRSETDYQGETVECIRVRAAKNGKSPAVEAPKPAPMAMTSELTDDDIPFAWIMPLILPITGIVSAGALFV